MLSSMRLWIKAALLALIPLAVMTGIGRTLLSQGEAADGRSSALLWSTFYVIFSRGSRA